MRILLWHGYLLSGSGSNLYTANIARVWREAGHEVLLMCQERHVEEFPFIDAAGDFDARNESFSATPTGVPGSGGRVELVRPAIGEVLPVYVFDEYEGFSAKRFVDLTDEELDLYTQRNISALSVALGRFRPDAVITGHEVMGPYIALQACRERTDYLAKLHGSALEYAVKKQERFLRFATDGLDGARTVTGGSNYMLTEAASVIPGHWRTRARVVNPGCDVGLFKPLRGDKPDPPVVGYVGKFIAAKGVHNFLAALGLIDRSLTATIVGYGGLERDLHSLWDALVRADRPKALDIARRAEGGPLAALGAHLEGLDPDDVAFKRAARIDLTFAGRLEHGPLSRVLPRFSALVVPSVVPEAFGMVAAEAAACGVLPVVPAHSGIGEIGRTLERELSQPGLLVFDPNDPVTGIARALDRILGLPVELRRKLEVAASEVARRLWSWEHVAQQLLELASAP